MEHKEDLLATAGFKYLRCEVNAPDSEPRRAEGQRIGQAGSSRIARYPESFVSEGASDVPRATNRLYEFEWFGLKDGAWHRLAGDVHDVANRQALKDSLHPGERLAAGEALRVDGPDGPVRLFMQHNGNLVASYKDATTNVRHTLWDSITSHTGNANYLAFKEDGNLLLCAGDDTVLIDWKAQGMGGKILTVQGEDGNVVLYADEGRTVWATDRLTGGRIVLPLRPDLRAHPKRQVTGTDGHVRWIDV